MIDPKELRIGNFVTYSDQFGKWNDTIRELREDLCLLYNHGAYFDYNGLRPIPLTEEWLKRFGFEKKPLYGWKGNGADYQPETSKTECQDWVIDAGDEDYFFVRYESWYYRGSEQEEWIREDSTSVHKGSWYERALDQIPCKSITFVHQLQNLYFCLTGEELTIKSDEKTT